MGTPRPTAAASRHMPGSFGLAVLGLTSLVTTASGTLIAILSFAAQLKTLKANATCPLLIGVGLLGCALFTTLLAIMAAYFSENRFESGVDYPAAWFVAFGLVIGALLCLGVGMVVCFTAVIIQLT